MKNNELPPLTAGVIRHPASVFSDSTEFVRKVKYDSLKLASDRLYSILRRHHEWHCESKEVAFENGFKYDLAGEYGDSDLYAKTIDSIKTYEQLKETL